ncbi:hypothetical protein Tco_1352166, partial [Tanacetum coccineum]
AEAAWWPAVARLKMVVLAVGGDGGDDGEVVVMVLVDVVVAVAGLWWSQRRGCGGGGCYGDSSRGGYGAKVEEQWRWGNGDDGEARGGEWWSRSGRSVEGLSFYIFWVRRSLAGKVADGGGGGRNNSPEKMEGMEEEDDVCVCVILL